MTDGVIYYYHLEVDGVKFLAKANGIIPNGSHSRNDIIAMGQSIRVESHPDMANHVGGLPDKKVLYTRMHDDGDLTEVLS